MINNKKTIIIIGGSQSHVPFITSANNLGYNTVVFDIDDDCKGAKVADIFYKISTHDFDNILLKCLELNEKSKISAVITCSSSTLPLIIVSKICHKLDLLSYSLESVKLSTNKLLMKNYFVNKGISTPEWIVTDNEYDAINFIKKIEDKLIIKPSSGSQGSKGVNLINIDSDISKIIKNSKEHSSDSQVLIERYYMGQEYSVDGIVIGKKPIILSISKKYNLGPKYNFTMCGFYMEKILNNKILNNDYSSIIENSTKAVKAMNISNSFFSVDIILTKKGPFVLECGVLLDCKIDRLLYHSGIDIYSLFINTITGNKINYDNVFNNKDLYLNFLFSPKQGQLNINKNEVKNFDGIIEWESADGSLVKPPNSISDTIGWIITKRKLNIEYENNLYFSIK
tara:strand:+ start:2669 stop:3859 length:1191 start_codon:yes stop_codon:yes gene_type:complete